jgi:hypothetical protein
VELVSGGERKGFRAARLAYFPGITGNKSDAPSSGFLDFLIIEPRTTHCNKNGFPRSTQGGTGPNLS